MGKNIVWQPKIKRIEDEARDSQRYLDLQKQLEEGERIRWRSPPRQPEIWPADEPVDIKMQEEAEVTAMAGFLGVDEEYIREAKHEKEMKSWLPWIGLGAISGGLPQAAQAFGAASKIPWAGLRWPAKGALGAIYPEQWLKPLARPVVKGVAKLVEPIKEAGASLMQKLEAHRMTGILGWTREEYTKLAQEITGKDSMTKMTQGEGEKFVAAIMERGGIRDIILPAERGVIAAKAGKAEATAISRELTQQLGAPVKEIPKAAELGLEKKGIVTKAKEQVGNFTQRTWRLERLLDSWDNYPKSSRYNVTGGKFSQVFYNAAWRAENALLRGKTAVMDGFNTMLKAEGINIGTAMSRNVNIGGVDIPLGTRLGILAHATNPSNLRHITSARGNRIDPKLASEVLKSITPEEQKILNFFLKHWGTDTPNVAKAFEIANSGKKFPVVENYVPIIIKDPKKYIPIDEALKIEASYHFAKKWPAAYISKGFTKARSMKADQPIELDIFAMFTRRLQEVEHYKAFAPISRDWGRILGDRTFKETLANQKGKAGLSVLEQWTKDVAATNPLQARNWEERVSQMLRQNATTAVLGWNVTTMLKQFPSYMIGAARIGELNMLKGLYLSLADFKGTTETMKRLSPQIDKRIMARELAENEMLAKIGEGIFSHRNMRKLFMILTTTMDRTVVKAMYRGAYDDALKKVGSEKLAAEYAEKTIRETQPFFSIKDIPELWRAQGRSGELFKIFTMFQNQLNQYWNFYRHTVFGGWKAGEIGTPEAIKMFLEGFIVPGLMIGAVTRSDIARTPKEVLTDVATMGFSSVPVVGQFISSGLRGYQDNQGFITTEIFDKAQEFAYSMNEAEWEKALLLLPELAGYATGVPVTQPSRTIKNILEKGSGIFDDWLQLIWSSYTRENVRPSGGERGGRVATGR